VAVAVQLNEVPVTSELKLTTELALPEQIVWLKLMELRSLGNGSTRTTYVVAGPGHPFAVAIMV
jgi:hypothetical protein